MYPDETGQVTHEGSRACQATIHETAIGTIRRLGPVCAVVKGGVFELTPGQAREAAAALLAVADEIEGESP